MIGIGSPRASIESNFALRELVGADNFYTGIAKGEQARLQMMLKVLREGGIHTPSLRDIESYDAVLVLGEDITQTGACVAPAVRRGSERESTRNGGGAESGRLADRRDPQHRPARQAPAIRHQRR